MLGNNQNVDLQIHIKYFNRYSKKFECKTYDLMCRSYNYNLLL